MRIRTISAGIAIACVALVPAQVAAQKHGGATHGPSTHGPSTHGPSTQATGPKTHGNPHTATTKTHGNPHTTTTTSGTTATKTHGNPHTTTSGSGTPTTTNAGTTTGTATAATITPLNPIAQKLQGKPLGSRIEAMLPASMTLNTASAGFRNQGQFIAAVHVSQNLGIPFADLRAAMLGIPTTTTGTAITTTTTRPLSLGQAIQKLRPLANSTSAVNLAQSQATRDLQSTTTTTGRK